EEHVVEDVGRFDEKGAGADAKRAAELPTAMIDLLRSTAAEHRARMRDDLTHHFFYAARKQVVIVVDELDPFSCRDLEPGVHRGGVARMGVWSAIRNALA